MAVTKTIIKNTNLETVIKIAGTAGSATIDLQTDCVASTQATSGGTQTVNIVGFQFMGLSGSTVTVARNSVNVFTVPGDQPDYIDFEGRGYVDNVENSSDIVVTIAGAEAQCYLTLRKVSGYATKVETATFGIYDNQSVVGS